MNWEPIATRENVLLERFLRTEGYSLMFGSLSTVRLKHLFVVNKGGLTTQYTDTDEEQELHKNILKEHADGRLKILIPYWEDLLNQVKEASRKCLPNPTADNFHNFIISYKKSRPIIFYTYLLSKALEQGGNHSAEIGHWHEKSEAETSAAWDLLKPAFQEVAENYGLSCDELMHYLPTEFLHLLEKGTKIDNVTLRKRKEHYVIHIDNGKLKFAQNEEARIWEAAHIKQNDISSNTELKGQVASPGFAEGIVRIVNTQHQMEQMKPGEILVSVMTTPRLIPAVKKAVAIVTDEGGILSHAAIAAREFKIPCITGTKNATKLLKDGMQVNVDAQNGIIKIIKP